jgi:hypothetical protein
MSQIVADKGKLGREINGRVIRAAGCWKIVPRLDQETGSAMIDRLTRFLQ